MREEDNDAVTYVGVDKIGVREKYNKNINLIIILFYSRC